jgi:hypothetical protein
MANTFTNFDAAVTSELAFRGFVANSVGTQAANMRWGRSGTSGVYVPTISGAGIDDVSNLLGFANRQSITAGSVLVSFTKHKGAHFVIQTGEQSTSVVDLGAEYAERTGRELAAQVDADLFTEAAAGAVSDATAGALIAKADVMDAFETLNANNVPMIDRVWVFNPEGLSDVLGIDDFVGADKRGDGVSAAVTGQLGTLLGAPVLMSQNITGANSFYIYRSALALGINRDFEVFVGRVPGNFGITYELQVKYGVKTIDGNGMVKLTGY